MRDLQGIAEINGPRRAELQQERAETVAKSHTLPPSVVRFDHGQRVAVRHAQEQGR